MTRNKSEIQKRIMKLCERPFFEKNMFENQSSMHLINIQYYGLFFILTDTIICFLAFVYCFFDKNY